MKTSSIKWLVVSFLVWMMTGCGGISFKSNIPDGALLNENNISIVFTAQEKEANFVLNYRKRKLKVNKVNRTADSIVEDTTPGKYLKVVYLPKPPFVLPEGNVTVKLKIPYRGVPRKKIPPVVTTLHLYVDTLPPTIRTDFPEENSTIRKQTQQLSFFVTDQGSGVDPDRLSCTVNDQNWSEICRYTDGNYTLNPDSDHLLPSGEIRVKIAAADIAGNVAEKEFVYTGRYDETPPSIVMVDPTPGDVLTDPLHPFVFRILDEANGSGVDPRSVHLLISEENLSVALHPDTNDTALYRYTPDAQHPLPYGTLTLFLRASDRAGNAAEKEFSVFLREKQTLSARPVATPSEAYAPATLRFSPQVETDTAIQTYYWDFDGDGTWDRQSIFPETYTWKYTIPGRYTVRLKVVDAAGKSAEGTTEVRILNTPPQVTVDLSPSNGQVPLEVHFTVHASDSDGIALYEWDFDGDGIWDYNSTQSGDTAHTYTDPGVFNAKLKVTDKRGASTLYVTPATTVLAGKEGTPTVSASASPTSGSAPLKVHFDATADDPEGKGIALYEWDFDGDGTWDYNSSAGAATDYTYTALGRFYPRIRVRTADGRESFDALEISVGAHIALSVSSDTIEPAKAESATIHTTLSADTDVRLVVEDAGHNIVRELVPWTRRSAGDYDESWDGRDDAGNPLKEAPYYAVIYYKENGQIKHVDLRESSGGQRFRLSRNEAPRTFYPFDNRPLKITFTLPRAAEVVSFMGYSNSNTRIITFRNRRPLGRGSYTDIWYAQNDDGVLITPPPGRYFLYGVWGYTLADNAIFVKDGVRIEGMSVTPPILDPSGHDEEGREDRLHIRFRLSKAATVELTVFDAQSGVAAAGREYRDLAAGENEILYDARDNNGKRLHPGTYTLGIRATDAQGYRSLMSYGLMRVIY